ncbi:MAG TPA: pilus assembly protein PilM [Acidiferrobacterales bacterium]|nr:pilus assembly protein PilM [Acidiferrobacterales bacterium]
MFSFIKNKHYQPGLTAIGLSPDGVCMVRVAREAGRKPRLLAHDFRPLGGGQTLDKVLGAVARDHGLKRAHCTTVLGDSDYKLLLTEVPDVPPDELKQAVRWRVKDLIDFHINDTALDVFDIPGQEGAGAAREMYVVAARNQAIQERADLFQNAGVNLDVIDIPELAQRNLAALLSEDTQGVAMLSFTERGGLITLTRQGLLYLSRALSTTLRDLEDAATRAAHFDQVVLEVQRSFDYYESHFRQAPIRSLALAPLPFEAAAFTDYLGANLNAQVKSIQLAQLIEVQGEMPPALAMSCLTALGAALRQEVKAL